MIPQAYRKTEFTHRIGLAADKPAASDVLVGTLYFSTDTEVIERSNGITWDSYSGSLTEPVGVNLFPTLDVIVPDGYGLIFPFYLNLDVGVLLDIGLNAVVEIT